MQNIHEGWLTKSPPDWKHNALLNIFKSKWRRRYFVLYSAVNESTNLDSDAPSQLCYYEDETLEKGLGKIDLRHCQEVIAPLEAAQYKHVFAIKTWCKDRIRTYFLAVGESQELGAWVEKLCSVLNLPGVLFANRTFVKKSKSIGTLASPNKIDTTHVKRSSSTLKPIKKNSRQEETDLFNPRRPSCPALTLRPSKPSTSASLLNLQASTSAPPARRPSLDNLLDPCVAIRVPKCLTGACQEVEPLPPPKKSFELSNQANTKFAGFLLDADDMVAIDDVEASKLSGLEGFRHKPLPSFAEVVTRGRNSDSVLPDLPRKNKQPPPQGLDDCLSNSDERETFDLVDSALQLNCLDTEQLDTPFATPLATPLVTPISPQSLSGKRSRTADYDLPKTWIKEDRQPSEGYFSRFEPTAISESDYDFLPVDPDTNRSLGNSAKKMAESDYDTLPDRVDNFLGDDDSESGDVTDYDAADYDVTDDDVDDYDTLPSRRDYDVLPVRLAGGSTRKKSVKAKCTGEYMLVCSSTGILPSQILDINLSPKEPKGEGQEEEKRIEEVSTVSMATETAVFVAKETKANESVTQETKDTEFVAKERKDNESVAIETMNNESVAKETKYTEPITEETKYTESVTIETSKDCSFDRLIGADEKRLSAPVNQKLKPRVSIKPVNYKNSMKKD